MLHSTQVVLPTLTLTSNSKALVELVSHWIPNSVQANKPLSNLSTYNELN